jgi:hypothetical protein
MDARNLPTAAKALGNYAELFSKHETEVNYALIQLQRLADEFSR